MDTLQQFNKYINDNALIKLGAMILVAVSGGVDSVVLCDMLSTLKHKFAIGHVNYQLRGEESHADADFVKELAEKYKVPFHFTFCDTSTLAAEWKTGIQETARTFRYRWFEDLRKKYAYTAIATAHHADDNIETVLMHMARGTGLRGLQGIQPMNGKIVRPLLPFFKPDLIKYAEAHNLSWREDSSNQTDKYKRNHMRHQVIPQFEAMHPAFREAMLDNISHWNDAWALQSSMVDKYRQKCLKPNKDYHVLDTALLKTLPGGRSILFELLQPFGFNSTQVLDIYKSLEKTEARHFISSTHKMTKDRYKLFISEAGSILDVDSFNIHTSTEALHLPLWNLRFEKSSGTDLEKKGDHLLMELDYECLEFPLLLRPWHKGDYLYPFGMHMKKKKVSDLLTDKKISSAFKSRVYVLQSGARVAGVLGIRTDERFKVTPKTQHIFKIHVEKV